MSQNTNACSMGVIILVKQSIKQGVAVGFLLLMCLKAWVMPMLYLDYELRKEFIIDNFCVNKDRPELNCDGKCYLATRLAAAQKQEEKQAERNFMFKLYENITDCQSNTFSFARPGSDALLNSSSFSYVCPTQTNAPLSGIFHPPQRG